MTKVDYKLEQFYKEIGKRPRRKFEETITSFDRNIYWYDRDEVNRQLETAERTERPTATYKDHRAAIEASIKFFKQTTQHDIAMNILTHRYFKDYRNKTFKGAGNFREDYSSIIKKVGNLFSHKTNRMVSSSIQATVKSYKTPTLLQLNHLAGVASPVVLPKSNLTLDQWCKTFSTGAPESITYQVVGS